MHRGFRIVAGTGLLLAVCLSATLLLAEEVSMKAWKIHDRDRPQPRVVEAGGDGAAPSDAIVLVGGSGSDQWDNPSWEVADGVMTVGKGTTRTKQAFGDCQLHLEWATPAEVEGSDQGRGNSGVFLMEQYEVQILDSYENTTYPDGQASAIYGQSPPLVNASRPPGEWQTYDIVFHRPRFDGDGEVVSPATVTVLHNGVLTQDHFTLTGPTGHHAQPPYAEHADKLPITLQDHGNPIRFRNIWVRELE